MNKDKETSMKKSDITKLRLLDAATVEFAAYGIAGGRVDRIAASAKCNKQAIYAYFESKDRLFDAVFDRMVEETVQSVPIDADDLPGYAARLFDHYRAHPEVLRLARWHTLERNTPPPQIALDSASEKLAAIRTAQEAGTVTRQFKAENLLELLLTMSRVGAEGSFEGGEAAPNTHELRRTLVDAVQRVVEPRQLDS
jgi:AcrR family transcriptional regulator